MSLKRLSKSEKAGFLNPMIVSRADEERVTPLIINGVNINIRRAWSVHRVVNQLEH
ncbi:hypothetical protein D3C77_679490 [compost metagenome]